MVVVEMLEPARLSAFGWRQNAYLDGRLPTCCGKIPKGIAADFLR